MPAPTRTRVGRQVRVPKTAEPVAAHPRRQIVRGELNPGDALPPESGLMEQFGISRPTLREAFRALESESLIMARRGAHGGARVSAPEFCHGLPPGRRGASGCGRPRTRGGGPGLAVDVMPAVPGSRTGPDETLTTIRATLAER